MKRYRSILQVRTEEIFDELSKRFSTGRFTEMQATELVIKAKKFIDNSVRCIKRKFLRYAKQWPQFENILAILGCGVGKSRFAKDLYQKISITLTQEYQFNLYCSNSKMEDI